MPNAQQYQQYLKIISNPDKMTKLVRLDFLNDDGSVAFSVDNNERRGTNGYSANSRAFLQDGTLSVS